VYLDHAAATPMRPEVREALAAVLDGVPGNPSSTHVWGREARRTLEDARSRIAHGLAVQPEHVFFVRGGTESNNLAILGRADQARAEGRKLLMVRSTVEHSAVRESMGNATSSGGAECTVALRPDGSMGLSELSRLLDRDPILVSVMWVNHETGIILPVERVGELCRQAGVPFHVDGVQAAGRIGVEPGRLPIDLLSVSAHKLGGPRGTGVLVVRDRSLLSPRLFGGGQEAGLRPGTEDVAGAVGMAVALETALDGLPAEAERLAGLRHRLESGLVSRIPGLRVHGVDAARAPHILNVGVPGLPRDVLPGALDLEGVAVSAGSACRSGSTTVSPVLEALYGPDEAGEVAPLRLSVGWPSTPEDVDRALQVIPGAVERIRSAGIGRRV